MSTDPTTADRHAPILAELAELGLSLARAVHGRALAAETPAELAEMTLAFHRISRSVRQTLALDAKLERDRARQAQVAEIEAIRTRPQRTLDRKCQLRTAMQRAIWDEAEGAEAEILLDVLNDALTEESLSDDFLTDPIEVNIERIRHDLGMASAAVAGVQQDFPPGEGDRRSSA